jgi:hypothetical protein
MRCNDLSGGDLERCRQGRGDPQGNGSNTSRSRTTIWREAW